MKERPIIMSGPMVRALLAGTKTQTRRLVKPLMYLIVDGDEDTGRVVQQSDPSFGELAMEVARCPHGAAGDRLWVRETHGTVKGNGIRTVYRADGEQPMGLDGRPVLGTMTWTSPIFMKRVDSRLTLEITDVRCERLQSITDEDIRAEGVTREAVRELLGLENSLVSDASIQTLWKLGWDAINGARAPFASNPWIWALTFRCVEGAARC